MAIVLARVDNRLVHGQILSAWLPALAADAIVVLDDEAARNTLVRSAMAIAIPPDATFDVAPVAKAAEAVARIPAKSTAIVLIRDVADAARLVDLGVSLGKLNLGNVHFSQGRVAVSQAVYLSPDEVTTLEKLEKQGLPVELRTLPRDPPLPLSEVRRRVDAGGLA